MISFSPIKVDKEYHVFIDTMLNSAIDPLGHMQRRTLLNTEYEDLHLRFQVGIQINASSILLTSEGAGTINLVRMTL